MDDSSKPKDDAHDESSVRQEQVGVNGIPGSLRMEGKSSEGDKMPGKCGKTPLERNSKPEDEAFIGSVGRQQHNAEGHRKLEDSSDGNKLTENYSKIPGERDSKPEDEELIGPIGLIGQQYEAGSTQKTEDSSEDCKMSGIYPTIPESLNSDPKDEALIGPVGRPHVGKHDVEDPQTTEDAPEGNAKSGKYPKIPRERKSKSKDEALVGPPGKQQQTADPPQTKYSSKDGKMSEKYLYNSGRRDSKPKDETLMKPLGRQQHNAESHRKIEGSSKGKTNPRESGNPRNRGLVKFTKRFKTFGVTVKKFWDVWGRFKMRNNQDPNPTVPDKTLGVPGFEEIACIEVEVPDIMMTDKDRVRTSCKECMQHPPAFPSKEQVKAKLIAADKYYGVRGTKSQEQSDTMLEHDADYYDVDGTVVRPSWRFILERPLVEQYVLMTNYIRKVSVISEMKEERVATKFIEEEDSGSDTEYKKFEQKFIKERRELLKPILKPKTQEIAIQTSFICEQTPKEELKESVSEISLYPESEESTNSPEASAVTIVTSRDYSSPLQSDFDGRTTDKSASNKEGNWWESQACCQPSESFQTSHDSVNNNVSSGSDGPSIPIKAAWGETCLRPTQEPSNEDELIVTSSHKTDEDPTTLKLKDSKKVRFSPVVTCYQGPDKNAAVYRLPDDLNIMIDIDKVEPPQNTKAETPAEDRTTEEPGIIEEPKTPKVKSRPPKTLTNILQDRKSDQIVSVTLPEGWHKDRILHNEQRVNVAVSRATARNRPITKKISFQQYEEIPDVQYSNPQVSSVRDKTDVEIQTQTQASQENILADRIKAATTSKLTKPTTIQSVYTNAHFKQMREPARIPLQNLGIIHKNINVNSRRNDHQVMESVGTGTNIQSVANHQVIPRQKPGTTGNAHWLNAPAKLRPSHTRLQFTSNPPAQHHFPSANQSSGVSRKEMPPENIPYYQPMQHSTYSNCDVKNEPRGARPRTLSDPSLSERLLPKTHVLETSHKQQQGSTDTEGSSTSNDHIKLKASPACFFKVATPTDLSKISVDDFYPDVPEIDAELSQNSETSAASAPKVELVFDDKVTALKCMPDTYFRNHRVTKTEENSILQSSAVPTSIIMVSPGIEIRGLKVTQQMKPSRAIASKAPAVTAIQSSSKKAKSPIRGSSILPEKASITGQVLKEETMLEIGVKQILNTKEVRKSGTLPLKEVQSSSLDPQKQETKTLKQQLLLTTLRGGLNTDKREDSCGEDVMGKAQKCPRQLVFNGRKLTDDDQKVQEEIGKEKSERGTLERQLNNFVNDQENQSPLGRGTNFVRTLSSLAEETSSVMESTSSPAVEKVIDMPVIARSVEELKTIFEKKPEASTSVVPELGENQSHSIKCMEVPEGKLQTIEGIGIPGDMTAVVKGAESSQPKETFYTKIPGECSRLPTGQNLPSDAEKLETLKVTKAHATKGTAGDENKTITHSDGANDSNKNPALIHEEFSAQQISQIDVIRPSEIYSNTSMYFSTSDDRVANFTKARTAFEPMTLDDEEASCTSGKNVKCLEKLQSESTEFHTISTKGLTLKDEDPKQQQERKPETKSLPIYGRDSCLVGYSNQQTITDKNYTIEKDEGETEELSDNNEKPSSDANEQNGVNRITNEAAVINQKADSPEDNSKPTETKQWLMDVIPMFSKHTRFHGFRPQKSVRMMREGADTEAVRNRQEAVKPVFKFLKRQRDMEDNK